MLDPDVGFYGATRDETSLIAVYEDSYDSQEPAHEDSCQQFPVAIQEADGPIIFRPRRVCADVGIFGRLVQKVYQPQISTPRHSSTFDAGLIPTIHRQLTNNRPQ